MRERRAIRFAALAAVSMALGATSLAPLAGRGRIASQDAIRVREYRSDGRHRTSVCPSPQPSPRKERGEEAHRRRCDGWYLSLQ